MSRRDTIAAMALQGLLAGGIHTSDLSVEETAQQAYDYADAMIEREDAQGGKP